MAILNRSIDPTGRFDSPLGQGRVDKAYENLLIYLLHHPNVADFAKIAALSEHASSGGGGGKSVAELVAELGDVPPDTLVLRYLEGSLQQFFESDSVVFLIYGCSRGLTHELVRTRKGAWYVQQTMRHSNMGNANVRMPQEIAEAGDIVQKTWLQSVRTAVDAYQRLVERYGLDYQDARTVLPIATETWIVMGMPLSTFLETYAYRACYMFYPEMRYVFRRMGEMLVEKCPWLAKYVKITCEKTKMCEFRGTEATSDYCPLPWAHIRRWLSKNFRDSIGHDVAASDHVREICALCHDVETWERVKPTW